MMTTLRYVSLLSLLNLQISRPFSILQEQEGGQTNTPPPRPTEEWMLICQQNADLQPSMDTQDGIDWTLAAHSYPTLEEAPSFISQQRQAAGQHVFTTSANPANLQGKQQQVYTIVQQHQSANSPPPLRMIAQLAQGSPTSSTASDFSCSASCWLQLQLVWPPSTLMARPSTPSSACPPEESSRTWRERDSPNCSRHSQR